MLSQKCDGPYEVITVYNNGTICISTRAFDKAPKHKLRHSNLKSDAPHPNNMDRWEANALCHHMGQSRIILQSWVNPVWLQSCMLALKTGIVIGLSNWHQKPFLYYIEKIQKASGDPEGFWTAKTKTNTT